MGQAESRGGCLKKRGAGTPLQTMSKQAQFKWIMGFEPTASL